ncbi:MAG: class I SAM-dependent methyltransferase [Candidatus Methanofastidiosia archaeon]
MEHYFSRHQSSGRNIINIEEIFEDQRFSFITDSGVFSKGKLDKGTKLLLSTLPKKFSKKFLDLGCGWGAIGIIFSNTNPQADVCMSDINQRALELAKENAKLNKVNVKIIASDIFENIKSNFDIIATNPPIRAGKDIVYKMVEESSEHLNLDGKFFAVIRTKQGARSLCAEIENIFGNAEIVARESGYKVYKAKKYDRCKSQEKTW